MDGELHYRLMPHQHLRVRSGGDRRLFGSVLRWNTATRLSTGGAEWFNRGTEPPLKAAVLTIKHGGPRAGQVIQWRSTVLGLDAVLLADETATGEGLLELLDRWGEVPLSPAFIGDGKRHSTGVQWRGNLHVPELSVVPEGEFAWARLRRYAA